MHHRRNQTGGPTSNALGNGSSSPLLKTQAEPEHSSRSSSPSLLPPNNQSRRSRSPDIRILSTYSQPQVRRAISPNAPARKSQNQNPAYRYLLPNTFCITLPFPWGRRTIKASGDVRKALENILLLLSLLYGIRKTWDSSVDGNNWIALGKSSENENKIRSLTESCDRTFRNNYSLDNLSRLDASFVFFSPTSITSKTVPLSFSFSLSIIISASQ